MLLFDLNNTSVDPFVSAFPTAAGKGVITSIPTNPIKNEFTLSTTFPSSYLPDISGHQFSPLSEQARMTNVKPKHIQKPSTAILNVV
jgi:hypothetical protein